MVCLKVLPHDSKARRLFVTSGGLKKVQEIKAEPGSLLQENINSINSCYPEEIVRCTAGLFFNFSVLCFRRSSFHDRSCTSRYYSPGYSEILLERVEAYQPT